MSIELKPCPFCGGSDFEIVENGRIWSGMKYSEPVSVGVRHWCPATPGQPSRMIERVGRDEASAVTAWNTRHTLSQQPAIPEGWVPCIVTYEGQHPEEVAYGPQRMMERLKKWLDRYFEMKVVQQPATGEPVAWLDEMLADTREVFDAGGSETPQVVRDVIEYVKSWVTVYSEKNHPAPAAQPAPSEPATTEPVVSRNPFASRCYTMSESHLSGHRLIVGFEKLGDAQDAHEWVARQGRGDFTHPAPSVPNDHQIAALVNKVRDIARMFHDHQSLRERIAIELVPALKASQEVKSNAERWRYAIADGGNQSMNFIDIFDDWDGDGSFVEAFDKARLADKKEGSAA